MKAADADAVANADDVENGDHQNEQVIHMCAERKFQWWCLSDSLAHSFFLFFIA
jgi:hypothetical protein